jgi:hypothetical protein
MHFLVDLPHVPWFALAQGLVRPGLSKGCVLQRTPTGVFKVVLWAEQVSAADASFPLQQLLSTP